MRRLVLAIFVLSGAAGLVYEVVWARQLVLVFGNTTQAVSAILTGFFGGMAIGSAVGGRIADRVQRTLRLYGILEIVLVVIVLATPITFRLLHEVYRGAFGSLETAPWHSPWSGSCWRSWPWPGDDPHGRDPADADPPPERPRRRAERGLRAAVRGEHDRGDPGGRSGRLLPHRVARPVGHPLRRGGLLGHRRRPRPDPRPDPGRPRPGGGARPAPGDDHPAPVRPADRRAPRLAIMLAFVSGLTALAYQVLWTRLIASGTGNSTYVFSLILVVFLLGLALGAMAFNILRTRLRRIVDLLAAAQIAIAVLAMFGMVILINSLGGPAMDLTQSIGQLVGEFTQRTILVVLPATFIMGLSFPAASALVAGEDEEIASRRRAPARGQHVRGDRRDVRRPVPRHPARRFAGRPGSHRDRQRADRHRARVRRPDRAALPRLATGRCGAVASRRGGHRARGREPVHRPERRPDPARPRDHRTRPRTRSRPSRPARSTVQAALGDRHVDDPAHGRREAHAGPAAHPAAGLEGAS